MFEEFKEKKFNEYINLLQFPEGNINIQKLHNSTIPLFIINFFEYSFPSNISVISRNEFEKTLRKSIIFNINYIIKPKATLLKFIFGNVETRPSEYVKQKLNFFQFYNYYTSHIENFINLNDPLVISKNQIEHLVNEINAKILQEILNPTDGEAQRLNLIKLLYYFFLDLTENNPINIKLPKKILSVFFNDKGYKEIKQNIDKFFSEEVFIQEATDLIKPVKKEEKIPEPEFTDDKSVEEYIVKAKMSSAKTPGISLLDSASSEKDIKQTLKPSIHQKAEKDEIIIEHVEKEINDQVLNAQPEAIIKDISELKTGEIEQVELLDKKVNFDENIFSGDEKFKSQINEANPLTALSEEEQNIKKVNNIFCEETYRKKIIRKIFFKDEKKFNETVLKILECHSWKEASKLIEDIFNKNHIKYFSGAAVKFVDQLENHFTSDDVFTIKIQGNQ